MKRDKENKKLKVVHNASDFKNAEGDVIYEEAFKSKEEFIVDEPKENKEVIKEQYKQEKSFKDLFEGAEWFDYADLVINCSCGHTTKIQHPAFKNIKTGIQLPFLYTVKNYEQLPGVPALLAISCEKCGHKLSLEFIESEEKPIEEAKIVEDEKVISENKEEDKN